MATKLTQRLLLATAALCSLSAEAAPDRAPDDAPRISITIGAQRITATLENNAAARAFARRLPVQTTLEDFNRGTEKIYYPDKRLGAEGEPSGCAPRPGDIVIYVPWGSVAIFCKPWHHSKDLLRIGRIDADGIRALQRPGDINVSIKALPPHP